MKLLTDDEKAYLRLDYEKWSKIVRGRVNDIYRLL